jgi:signal transduction histidine kinase
MLHEFIRANREDLLATCAARAASRNDSGTAGPPALYGAGRFLDQLVVALALADARTRKRSSAKRWAEDRVDKTQLTEIDHIAAQHGMEMLGRGLSVDSVIHEYGDLCQAITQLAQRSGTPISAKDFELLNWCLDNAMAAAVTEYAHQRDLLVLREGSESIHERLGRFADELRDLLNSAVRAVSAIKAGAAKDATTHSAVLDRSLNALHHLIDRSLAEIRLESGMTLYREAIAMADFIAEIEPWAQMEARASGCSLVVLPVSEDTAVNADRPLLSAALKQLLRTAFKATQRHGKVLLSVASTASRVLVEVEDTCGGLPAATAAQLARTVEHRSAPRPALGSEHAMSKRSVEENGGRLRMRNLPGAGCVFTIDLPRQSVSLSTF